ncbi:hypothetical protein OAS86_00440 [Gammaproteobacteria bacterium]|nr:hypothetical protein [Gammaproteobacteria bacterium]
MKSLFHFPDDDEGASTLDRQAQRITDNRFVAGVHYPMDGDVGLHLGKQLDRVLVVAAGQAINPGENEPVKQVKHLAHAE